MGGDAKRGMWGWGWFRRPLDRKSLGNRGERVAARFLKRKGYRILARNVETGRYELDLVCRDGDTIVFVEVRSRLSDEMCYPEDSIGAQKQYHVRQAVKWYINRHYDPERYYRIDVVAVTFTSDGAKTIRHFPDAF